MQALLRSTIIYTSSCISMSLSISQGGRKVVVNQEQAYFHLKEENGILRLYVPKNRARRDVCLRTELPGAILRYLGAHTSKVGELGNIITTPSLSSVNMLLELKGIIDVPGLEPPDHDSGYDSDSSDDGDTPSASSSLTREATPSHDLGVSTSRPSMSTFSRQASPLVVERTVALSSRETSTSVVLEQRAVTQASSVLEVSESPELHERVDHYKKLLDVVVRQARRLADLPNVRRTAFAAGAVDSELNIQLALGQPYVDDREGKIGAAGELFVSYAICWRITKMLMNCRCSNSSKVSGSQTFPLPNGKAPSALVFARTTITKASRTGRDTRLRT